MDYDTALVNPAALATEGVVYESKCLRNFSTLVGEEAWQDFQPGESFTVAAGQVFHLQIAVDSAYLCTYE